MLTCLPILSGIVVGAVLGLFGSGGSLLTLPVLVYGMGMEPQEAVATSLVLVGVTAAINLVGRLKDKALCPRAGLSFGLSGMVGTYSGTQFAALLTGDQQMGIFALVMLLAAILMIFKNRLMNQWLVERTDCQISQRVTLISGLGIGVLSGVVGVGGGFLIVPALSLAGLTMNLAVGTSLLVIVLNCIVGVVGYSGRVDYDGSVIIPFLLASTLVSLGAAQLAKRMPVKRLEKTFAVFVMIVAMAVIGRILWV
jgi:uncharacterized membrane protein YfcA